MVLLVGTVAWLVSPSQPTLPAQPSRSQASTATTGESEGRPQQGDVSSDAAFRITRVSDRPAKLTTVIRSAEPRRVEYISDVELFIAMRGQGIDAGLMRVDGRTELAFNDEESRRRFERGLDSAE
jgi:hypothetical protein